METTTSPDVMSKNKEIVKKIYTAFETGNTSDLNNIISADAIDNNPPENMTGKGPELVKNVITLYKNAFPDLKVKVNAMVAEGDKVISFLTFTGTHKGELFGIPATNKQVKVEGFDKVKIQNGKITERWGVFDQLGMFTQLGVIPEMSELIEKNKRKEAQLY